MAPSIFDAACHAASKVAYNRAAKRRLLRLRTQSNARA